MSLLRELMAEATPIDRTRRGKSCPKQPAKLGSSIQAGRYGKVYLHSKRNLIRRGDTVAFLCTCKCGQEVYLKPSELRQRKAYNLGCLLETCPLDGERAKDTYGAERAIRKQIDRILSDVPHEVCSEWGGFADTDNLLGMDAGKDAMLEYIFTILPVRRKAWRIRRKDPSEPYRKGNIALCETDDEVHEIKTIEFNGAMMSANDICEMFDVELYRLMELLSEYGASPALIEKLTEEQTCHAQSLPYP